MMTKEQEVIFFEAKRYFLSIKGAITAVKLSELFGLSIYRCRMIKKAHLKLSRLGTPRKEDHEALKEAVWIYLAEKKKKQFPPSVELIMVSRNVQKYKYWILLEMGVDIS